MLTDSRKPRTKDIELVFQLGLSAERFEGSRCREIIDTEHEAPFICFRCSLSPAEVTQRYTIVLKQS